MESGRDGVRRAPVSFARILGEGFIHQRVQRSRVMGDQDRIRQREHWQAIAEQLGLSPEFESALEPTTEAAKESSAEKTDLATSAKAGEPKQGVAEPLPPGDARIKQQTAHRGEDGATAFSPPPEPETSDGSSPASQAKAEVVSPKRGRRRRTTDTAAAAAIEDKEAGLGKNERREGSGRRGRQGRSGRRRNDKSRGKQASHASDDLERSAAGEEPAVPADEADDDFADDAYTWNVPSWNELIASLYRPER